MRIAQRALVLALLAVPTAAQQTELEEVYPPLKPVHYNNYGGAAVAISGEWAAIGDYAGGSTGEVYLFRRTPSGWRLQQLLVGEPRGSSFGLDLAIDGDTLVVGDFQWGFPLCRHGKAYVFQWSGSEWTKVQELLPGGLWNETMPWFGHRLALSGDTLVVSATGVDQPVKNAGAIFVYERIQGTWVLVQRFGLPPVPDVLNGVYGKLGYGVGVSGNTIVAGAPVFYGAVLVYERGPSGWARSAILRQPSPEKGDFFGGSCDVSGDTIAVGAPAWDNMSSQAPKAYIYERDASGTWVLARELVENNGWLKSAFGASLAIDGDRLVVGAPEAKVNWQEAGIAYLYLRRDGVWPAAEDERLVSSHPNPLWGGELLGTSVDIDRDYVLAGSPSGWVGDVRPGKGLVFTVEQGTSWCEPPPPGPHARLSVTGSEVAREHRLTLAVRDAPPGAHGLFLISTNSANLPFGNHRLCIGTPLVRLATAHAGRDGVALQDVKWTDPRLGGILVVGDTWYCQLVHEGMGSGQRMEMSNAVLVTLR